VGRTAVNTKNSICSPQTTYYRLNDDYLLPEYLMYYFSSLFFQNQLNKVKQQTTRDFVSISKQYKLEIIVLPIDTQQKMIDFFDKNYTSLKLLINELERSKNKIESTRKKILQEAYKGTLMKQLNPNILANDLLSEINKDKVNILKTSKKTSIKIERIKVTLEKIMIENFKGRSFSFNELESRVSFSNERLKKDIFKMLDKNKNLNMFFDKKANTIKYTYNED
jgi:type I restriction enzyme S subunit